MPILESKDRKRGNRDVCRYAARARSFSTVLRREALLPNERSRGLGTVAVVCTMAGVASGLALATTLMAMQVADSMSVRSCPYRDDAAAERRYAQDHGFLGIRYVFQRRCCADRRRAARHAGRRHRPLQAATTCSRSTARRFAASGRPEQICEHAARRAADARGRAARYDRDRASHARRVADDHATDTATSSSVRRPACPPGGGRRTRPIWSSLLDRDDDLVAERPLDRRDRADAAVRVDELEHAVALVAVEQVARRRPR